MPTYKEAIALLQEGAHRTQNHQYFPGELLLVQMAAILFSGHSVWEVLLSGVDSLPNLDEQVSPEVADLYDLVLLANPGFRRKLAGNTERNS